MKLTMLLLFFLITAPQRTFGKNKSFPLWFTPDYSKFQSLKWFIDYMNKEDPENLYSIKKLKHKKISYNSGVDSMEVFIHYKDLKCEKNRVHAVWFSSLCKKTRCPALNYGIRECLE